MRVLDRKQLEIFLPVRSLFLQWHVAETRLNPAGLAIGRDSRLAHVMPIFIAGNRPSPERAVRELDRTQRATFIACFLGWALDAFDFFLLTFVIVPIGQEFGRSVADVGWAIALTLMMRPVGAFVFGLLGDRFGRRLPLMIDIIFYSAMELLTAFAPNFTVLLILRALYGIGMGGEWGLGASLSMETLPAKARGLFSGILQQGYAFGFLLAAVVYWLVFPHFGWRGLFVAGAMPALLVLFIRTRVPESPAWQRQKAVLARASRPFSATIRQHWR